MAVQRDIRRVGKLPPFKCDINALEALMFELRGHFRKTDSVHMSLTINLPDEKLTFEEVAEVRTYKGLPAHIEEAEFGLHAHWDQERQAVLVSKSIFGGYSVSANAASPTWCAGATELVRDFAKRNRRWYFWFNRVVCFVVIVVVMVAPLLIFGPRARLSLRDGVLFFSAVLSLFGVFFFFERIFPSFVLEIRREETFWRRYATELTLLLAAIPALAVVASVVYEVYHRLR